MQVQNTINPSSATFCFSQIEYFLFEADFIEAGVRCIPMIVRFKMDAVGIKLALATWCKFTTRERKQLAVMPCETAIGISAYHDFLNRLVVKYTGNVGAQLKIDDNPLWSDLDNVPEGLQKKAMEFNWIIGVDKWQRLTDLQRFALLKLFSRGTKTKISLRQ
jgi:hypothetical protein